MQRHLTSRALWTRRLRWGAALAAFAAFAAVARAAGPAARPAPPAREPGPLLIVGGGRQPDELVRRFVGLAGGPGVARIAVLPMASAQPEESARGKIAQLESYGAAAFPLVVTREQAMDPRTVRQLDGATGVWFTGGDQKRLASALLGTPLLEALHELRRAGAVIGGTSAGAAVMSDSMITGNQIVGDSIAYLGDEYRAIARGRIEVAPGFGFLPGVLVDQHFIARERHNRLISAVLERRSMLGVGIDESTALEVRPDGTWIVRGRGQVVIYDARHSAPAPADGPLGAADVRLHVLPPGSTFDPASGRAVLPPTGSSETDPTGEQPT